MEKQGKMEEEGYQPKRKNNKKKQKNKNTNNDYKIKRYWRRLLQVSDWMVSVPPNISEFFVAVRGEGDKCILIMKYNSIEICDRTGTAIAELPCPLKQFNGTILQVYYEADEKRIIVSDLIVWKSNPMTGSQFDFRYAWTTSNLNLKALEQATGHSFFFSQYFPCTSDNIRHVYETATPYKK